MLRIRNDGFTLIELLITIVLIGIIAAIAMPSFKTLLESRKLIASANQLQADFQFTKSEAIKINKPMFISFRNVGADNWCYGINPSTACDCSSAGDCATKVTNNSDLPAVTLQSVAANDISYNQFSGFSSATGNFTFTLGGRNTGVNLSFNGQSRACSDDGLGGFTSCP